MSNFFVFWMTCIQKINSTEEQRLCSVLSFMLNGQTERRSVKMLYSILYRQALCDKSSSWQPDHCHYFSIHKYVALDALVYILEEDLSETENREHSYYIVGSACFSSQIKITHCTLSSENCLLTNRMTFNKKAKSQEFQTLKEITEVENLIL